MRVQFVTLSAGPAGIRRPGTVHEVGEAEGSDLVAGGYAVVIETAKAVKPVRGKKADKDAESGDGEKKDAESGESDKQDADT